MQEAQIAAEEILTDVVIPFSVHVGNDLLAILLLAIFMISIPYSIVKVDPSASYMAFSFFIYRTCYILHGTNLWEEFSQPLMTLVVSLLISHVFWIVIKFPKYV